MAQTYELKPVDDAKLEAFRTAVEAMLKRHHVTNENAGDPPTIELEPGRVYVRVCKKDGSSRAAFCFVEKATGNILKPANFKAPAKHARGNVNTPTHGVEFVGPYGPPYLR